MQTKWAAQINPVIANSIIQGVQLTGIVLNANTPKTVATTLSRMQLGWIITDNMASCSVWRTQPFNSNNLTLESSADTTISIWVY